MWTVKLFAVTLILTVFIRDTESWWQRRRGSSPPSCSPRACQVSSWSTWSTCTHQCGTSGKQERVRTVTVAATCAGSCSHLSEIRSCNTDNCQNSGTPTSKGCSCLPGYFGTCCEIVIARSTLEPRPTPTTQVTTQPPSIQGSPPPCIPRACQVSSWSTWSPCTHQCGTSGTQTRTRTKTVVEACGGSCPHTSEMRSCNRDKCQNSGTPTSNGCSCLPGYNGTCCEIVPSPVDGRWSDWSDWSPCLPCAAALRNRSRTCTNPAPAFGGQQCSGHSNEIQLCPKNCSVSGPTPSPTLTPVAHFNTTKFTTLPSFTVEPTTSGLTPVMSSSVVPPVTISPHIQRILVDLLGSLTQIIQRLQALLGGSLSPADFDHFRNETMQILRQAENQLLAPSTSRPSNMQMAKRAIPRFPNPQDLVQMLEDIQRRLLG